MSTTITVRDLVIEAKTAARRATNRYISEKLENNDGGLCGFAWVTLYKFDGKKIRKNSKIGKALEEMGVTKSYDGYFQLWNPSQTIFQNVDCKSEGARAAAEVFSLAGFQAYAGSRLD